MNFLAEKQQIEFQRFIKCFEEWSLEGKCSRVVVFPVLSGDRRRCFESSAPPESKSLKCFEFKPLEKLAVFT